MELTKNLILRRPPPGPACGRTEDRLRGRLEGRTGFIQLETETLPARVESAGAASIIMQR